jgi:hypothetical protein
MLLITCGALAKEVIEIRDRLGWNAKVLAIPAQLHMRPERIPDAVHQRLQNIDEEFDRTVIVYGDCGTGGQLDRMLDTLELERIPGPHCYEQYSGETFQNLMEEEPGTFFLTDFLARSFRKLVFEGLGLHTHPELREDYFGAYRRIVYLQQSREEALLDAAQEAAELLNLPLEIHYTGMTALEDRLSRMVNGTGH